MISVVLHSDCFKSTTNCRDSAFSLRGLEAGLPAFQLPMFSKCDALPKGERFVWHVCLRNPFPLFLFGFRSLQSLPEAGFWEPQYVPPGLHYACIMPIPSLQLKIKTSLMQRSKGFGHGVVVSKICYVIYSDCVQDLDYRILIVLSVVTRGCCKPMSNCRDWAFRNIGLEVWLPAFQPPMVSKCDALPKGERFVWHVCLRNPFPLFLLGIPSIHSQPEAGFWEPQYVPPGLHYGCIMPIPSLQLQKKNLSHAGKQSGRGVVVSKICYNALIVLSIVLRDCCKRMNDCRDWAFRNIGLEEWLPAFQLLIFEYTSINAEKRYVRNVCLGNPCLLWYQSLHSPTEAWGPWEPQYAPPVLHSCCIMPTPSLQLQKKDQSHAEKQRVWSRSCGLQELLQYTDCSSMTAAKEGFSLRGLEAGLPAFQLLMFSKCDWKEMWGMLICLRNPSPQIPNMLFCKDIQLYNEEIRESVRQGWIIRVGSHNPAWKSPGSMFELWINDGFEWFFALISVPKFAVLARSKQLILMPVTVKFRLDFLVCGLKGHLL